MCRTAHLCAPLCVHATCIDTRSCGTPWADVVDFVCFDFLSCKGPQVLPGDIVVLGSDGLFDNVSDGEVVTIAEQLLRESCCTPSELARCLLHNAYHNSLDRTKVTPYSMAATEVFDMVYSGGKKDDISVVVAKVRQYRPTLIQTTNFIKQNKSKFHYQTCHNPHHGHTTLLQQQHTRPSQLEAQSAVPTATIPVALATRSCGRSERR